MQDLSELKELIGKYDIISFDIFDTLLLRPFFHPEDLFKYIEYKYNCIVKYKKYKDVPICSNKHLLLGFINLLQIDKYETYTVIYIFNLKFNPQTIFSVKNDDIRKVITILGIKFKFKSKKLIERKRWDELNNKFNYQIQQYNKVTTDLNSKLDLQTQRYNEVTAELNKQLNCIDNKINNIEKIQDFNKDEIRNNLILLVNY